MKKEFLPVGTVVILKGATKKVMICGFLSTSINHKNRIFDYSGCMYPEGLLSSDEICLFDNEDIDKVFYKGYESDESIKFSKVLIENYDKILKSIENN